jgi:general secretion pathway protein D
MNILVDVQVVSLPRAKATPLIRDLLDEKTAPPAVEKVQALIASDEAALIGWPMVITKSGERAEIEGIREIRYPTEYHPGHVEVTLTEKNGRVQKSATEVPGVYLSPVAAEFETRNTGITLEVEPTLSPDGKSIDLNLVPQHVVFRGMSKRSFTHAKSTPASREEITAEQPDFDTMKTQTSLQIKNGGRILLAVFPLSQPADHLELFLLHAETRQP